MFNTTTFIFYAVITLEIGNKIHGERGERKG